MENILRGELELSNNKIAFIGGFSYKTFNDIDAAESIGTLTPNAYDEYDFDAKLVSRLVNNQFLTVALQKVTQQNVPLYHKVAPGSYSIYNFDPQDRLLAYARHELHNQNEWLKRLSTTFSYQSSLEIRKTQKTGESVKTEEKDIADVYGLSFEIYSTPTGFWQINSGLEYYHDDIKSQTKSLSNNEQITSRGLYPDNSTFDNFGIYSLHSIDFKNWSIQAGARFNNYKLSIKDTTFGDVNLQPIAIAGNLAITYKLNDSFRLIGAVNNGFRTPNINDASSFGIADFRYEVPSTELKPEKSLTYEFGLKQKGDFISSSIFLFRTDLFDLITNTKTSFNGQDSVLINEETSEYIQYYHKENSNKARILGFEAQTEVQLNQELSFVGRLFYTFGENLSKNEPMRRIPPLNGVLALNWKKLNKVSVSFEYIFAAKQDRLSSGDAEDGRISDGGTPAWNLFNLNCSFQLKKWTKINLGLNNILDETYRIHGSGVDGYGRHLWLGIKLQF
jgi:hemoglobin/transferrin/lactoferrin receptor protein